MKHYTANNPKGTDVGPKVRTTFDEGSVVHLDSPIIRNNQLDPELVKDSHARFFEQPAEDKILPFPNKER